LRAVERGVAELLGREDGAVDVRLRGEVDDRVAAACRRGDVVRRRDVAVVELDVVGEVRAVAAVRQLVEDDDVLARAKQPSHEVRADEPGAAGHEDPHTPQVSAKPPGGAWPGGQGATSSRRRGG